MKKEEKLTPEQIESKGWKKNKWFFATGAIGRDMCYALVSGYFFMYVQFGLTLTVAQFATLSILIGVLGRIWDGINDPLMGTIIDGANFKWGKFKPWIFFGSVLTGILLLVMFNVRPFGNQEIYGWIYVGIMVVVYLLWEAAFTMNDIGYWGAIPSLSPERKKRDELTSLVIFFAGVGGGAIGLFAGAFTQGNILTSYTIFSIVVCCAMIISQTVVVATVKEGPRELTPPEEKASFKKTIKIIFRNKQLLWLSLGYLIYDIGSGILGALIYNLYYLEYGYDGNFALVMLVIGMGTMVLQALYPKITAKWTRKKIQWISFVAMAIGYAFIAALGWTKLIPFNPVTLAIGYAFIGVGGTYFYITTLINLTNCVEYNEYLTGERNEAVVSAVRPFMVKLSSATKSLLTTVILVVTGLYMISQQVSHLETQKSMFNDRVAKVINEQSIEDIKYYVTKLNEYGLVLEGLEKDSEEYTLKCEEIDNEIVTLPNDVLTETQTAADYIYVYKEMYILKKLNNEVVEYSKIKDISSPETYFSTDYTYEASFVFTYGEGDEKVNVNVGNEVYQNGNNLTTRIILRILVTAVPVIIALLSWYIQNHKFIVNEEYYEKMMKELEERRLISNSTNE